MEVSWCDDVARPAPKALRRNGARRRMAYPHHVPRLRYNSYCALKVRVTSLTWTSYDSPDSKSVPSTTLCSVVLMT